MAGAIVAPSTHLPRALRLKIDDVGAQFWSVALEQTQLTHFEVGPLAVSNLTATEAGR